MSPVAAPADRRFRRAHVKPARKRSRSRPLVRALVRYGLVAILLAYGAYRASAVVASARMLQVDRVVVRGNARLSKGEILAVLNGLRGESVVWTDLDKWRRRLLASPWVRDAALRRSLPSTVEVVVLEREPIGIGRINTDMYLVDDRGVVIDQYGPQYADLDLPIIDGLSTAPGETGAMTDQTRAELAARVIAAVKVKPEILRRLSQVDVSDVHNASVILAGDPAVIFVERIYVRPKKKGEREHHAAARHVDGAAKRRR
jgi:cell division septal protein FtsQ